MVIKIDYDKCCWKDGKCTSCCCEKCTGCVDICPVNAIERKENLEIDESKCIDCGACVSVCKHDALSIN